MDVAQYIARLRTTAAEHAIGGFKRGPNIQGDVGYAYGWQCGLQAGFMQAEEVLKQMLNDEQEKERAA